MNEILAMIFLAFYPYYFKNSKSLSLLETEPSASATYIELYEFFHNEEEIQCDLYAVFNAIMRNGIKDLYNNNSLETLLNSRKEEEVFFYWKNISSSPLIVIYN